MTEKILRDFGYLDTLNASGLATSNLHGLHTDTIVRLALDTGATGSMINWDVPVFSCSVGLKKPDPRIYQLACERLRANPIHPSEDGINIYRKAGFVK